MNWKKYIYAFIITLVIFLTAIYFSNYFNNQKRDQLKATENNISVDILTSETQFALLGEASCKDIDKSTLSKELGALGDKLNYLENQSGENNQDFITMKKYYSVLEIKDYLLTKKLSAKCPNAPVSILYFYTNDCLECTKIGYALTSLHDKYSSLKIYSFDYNLDSTIIKTLAEMYDINDTMPAVVIDGKLSTDFKNIDDIEKLLPKRIKNTATSTPIIKTK